MLKCPEGACSEAIRRTMRSNRSKDTGPELQLRRALWGAGLRGYRLHVRALPGRPDLVYERRQVAVFLHGCWWHGCPHCGRYRLPRTNSEYWKLKLQSNQERDAIAAERLEEMGYVVIVAWECEVKRQLSEVVARIRAQLDVAAHWNGGDARESQGLL